MMMIEIHEPDWKDDGICRAGNPLVQAYCSLRKGHDGEHWGHGPTWTWDDTGAAVMVKPAIETPSPNL